MTVLFFSKKKGKGKKREKEREENKSPEIIWLSEPGDVYFIGFELLVEMVGHQGTH